MVAKREIEHPCKICGRPGATMTFGEDSRVIFLCAHCSGLGWEIHNLFFVLDDVANFFADLNDKFCELDDAILWYFAERHPLEVSKRPPADKLREDLSMLTEILVMAYATKRHVRYNATKAEHVAVASVYIAKSELSSPPPTAIKITIEDAKGRLVFESDDQQR